MGADHLKQQSSFIYKLNQNFSPVFITNLSHLIVSIQNHSTIQNYCRCYNELNKRNRCSNDTKCTIPKLLLVVI